MSFSSQILLGLVLGVFTGLFFGEAIAPIGIVGDIYIKLMQMPAIPYIMFALVYGVGRLKVSEARLLASRIVTVVLALWSIGALVVLAMPLAFPNLASSSYYSPPGDLTESNASNFIEMFVPSNIFHALSEEVVPSIIVFCLLIGTLLMRSERKDPILALLKTGIEIIEGLANMAVAFTPFGVFAMAAMTAGTMTWTEFARLQVYIVIFLPMALLTALWVLPSFVSAFIPISWIRFLKHCREPLLVVFTTGTVLIALPLIGRKIRAILMEISEPDNPARAKTQVSYVDVVVPMVFALPTVGSMFTLFFIEYAGWSFASPLKGLDFVRLIGVGVPALFAEFSAVPFLLRMHHLPNDAINMFLVANFATDSFVALLQGVNLIVVATLVVAWATKQARFRKAPAIIALVVSFVAGAGLLFSVRSLLTQSLSHQAPALPGIVTLSIEDLQPAKVKTSNDVVSKPTDEVPPLQGKLMTNILKRQVIRVAYSPASMPWSYFNAKGDLVGYDIELAHLLARNLNCAIEFVPIDFANWTDDLEQRRFDIVMVSFSITPDRLDLVSFADGHRVMPAVFVVRDHRKDEFKSRALIQRIPKLRIAVLESTSRYKQTIKRFPNATIVPLKNVEDFFKPDTDLADVWYTEAGKGYAYAMLYPAFEAVNDDKDESLAEGYPIAKGESTWQTYLNAFLKIQRENGSEQFLFEKYVLGKHPPMQERRWSIIQDVLHWID